VAWTGSHMFRQWIADCMTRTQTGLSFAGDVPKVALYGNTITPDENVTAALSAYNATASQWLTAGELFQAGQWAQGGVALTGASGVTNFTGTADAVWYAAANTASGAACTLAGVYGDLVYDDTLTAPVADQGIAFHYFGGSQSVTAGTFSVIWNASGIWRISV
jgi:hypothetical protein